MPELIGFLLTDMLSHPVDLMNTTASLALLGEAKAEEKTLEQKPEFESTCTTWEPEDEDFNTKLQTAYETFTKILESEVRAFAEQHVCSPADVLLCRGRAGAFSFRSKLDDRG